MEITLKKIQIWGNLSTTMGAFLVAQTVKHLLQCRDLGSIPGSEQFHGEGKGNPLQYSCPENSTDRGAWRATVHGVTEQGMTKRLTHTNTHTQGLGRSE